MPITDGPQNPKTPNNWILVVIYLFINYNLLVKILKMESLFGGYTTPAEQVPEVKPGSILKQGYLDK